MDRRTFIVSVAATALMPAVGRIDPWDISNMPRVSWRWLTHAGTPILLTGRKTPNGDLISDHNGALYVINPTIRSADFTETLDDGEPNADA